MSPARQQVAVIDYGMGNLHSVASALAHVGPDVDIIVSQDAAQIAQADRVIFPGVGAIRDCMGEIRRLGMDAVVRQAVQEKPVLAVCVGLQAVMTHSEENGGVDCLDILPGKVRFFGTDMKDERGHRLKVPHMGWSCVEQVNEHPLWQGIEQNSRFYFVHSYYVEAENQMQIAGRCCYGKAFAAALSEGNLFAAQFHPEKSHTAGLRLLKNFLSWGGQST